MPQWAAVNIPRRILVILQTSLGAPAKHIPVPEHRGQPITADESVYVGVLTANRERKVVRTFINAGPCGEEEVSMHDVPESLRPLLIRNLDHLEELYFPKL